MKEEIREIYISVDIESDGPIPGDYSMVSIGAAVAGYMTTDGEVVKLDGGDPQNQFYAEIKPISEQWIGEAFAIGLFTGFKGEDLEAKRAYIVDHGLEPEEAMTAFSDWVAESISRHKARCAVFAAYPLGFDWMWTYWYLVKFSKNGSPFGHSRHIDIKSLYAGKAHATVSRSTKRNIPKAFIPATKHTHMALDDAIEQGELLMNLLAWDNK